MNEMKNVIYSALEQKLNDAGMRIEELIPIPATQDRMIQIKTIQHALEDFDKTEGADRYIIQIGPRIRFEPEEKSVGQQEQAPSPEEMLVNAQVLMRAEEYDLARNLYRGILKAGSHIPECLYGIALSYDAQQKVDLAIRTLRDSIAYQPSAQAIQYLAEILIRSQKDREAIDALERALHLEDVEQKRKAEIQKTIGNCYMRLQDLKAAERAYVMALKLDTKADATWTNLGAIYLETGKTKEAKQCFQQALSHNPAQINAMRGIAGTFMAEGNAEEAHDLFAKVLEKDVRNPSAIFFLVKCAFKIKKYDVAERILKNFIDTSPINANILYSLAALRFHLNKWNEARATVDQLLKLKPDHKGALQILDLLTRSAKNLSRRIDVRAESKQTHEPG